jgi:DNA-binding NarL/FixJ family response regulator
MVRTVAMPASEPVRVLVARFEDLVARGLRDLLADDDHVELVADGVPYESLSAALAESEPHVALVNFGSLRSPIEVHELATAHPGTRIVVLASRPTQSESNQMLAFGAIACLSKETQARDILNAIHLASRGLQVLPRRTADPPPPEEVGPELLTPREADVLELLQAGRSNAEIAASLHVGIETIRTHARNIYRKLGVRTRRELATLAVRPRG